MKHIEKYENLEIDITNNNSKEEILMTNINIKKEDNQLLDIEKAERFREEYLKTYNSSYAACQVDGAAFHINEVLTHDRMIYADIAHEEDEKLKKEFIEYVEAIELFNCYDSIEREIVFNDFLEFKGISRKERFENFKIYREVRKTLGDTGKFCPPVLLDTEFDEDLINGTYKEFIYLRLRFSTNIEEHKNPDKAIEEDEKLKRFLSQKNEKVKKYYYKKAEEFLNM